ncbi:MAG: TetR/AcrR family transcriptional regulator [Ilumatobacteraceae bacterium]
MSQARPSKRERTRRKLLDAGMQVMAERGEALTASDVVVAADVSNGTFYNHFVDRDDFIQTLARESLTALTNRSADDTEGADPAWRFAVASVRVLDAGLRDPRWGRAVLRLSDTPTPLHAAVQRHLRTDLADGHLLGRFTHGDDPVTVDLVTGTLMAALRRLVAVDDASGTSPGASGQTGEGFGAEVVARLLEAIGVEGAEARALAGAAYDDERHLARG